jgi:hypothetical protein
MKCVTGNAQSEKHEDEIRTLLREKIAPLGQEKMMSSKVFAATHGVVTQSQLATLFARKIYSLSLS